MQVDRSTQTKAHSAWLIDEPFLYYSAEDPTNLASRTSPLVSLIEGIFTDAPTPKKTLRKRIFTNYELNPYELELIYSCAKRFTVRIDENPLSPAYGHLNPQKVSSPQPEKSLRAHTTPLFLGEAELLARLKELKNHCRIESHRWKSDRAVSAILVSNEGHLIAESWNTNHQIKNRHAEWNLCDILDSRGNSIPKDATLWVSLKPCRMCAARIWHLAEDPSRLKIVYLEHDPGPRARGTLLDYASPARTRYLGNRHPYFSIEIQKQWVTHY